MKSIDDTIQDKIQEAAYEIAWSSITEETKKEFLKLATKQINEDVANIAISLIKKSFKTKKKNIIPVPPICKRCKLISAVGRGCPNNCDPNEKEML